MTDWKGFLPARFRGFAYCFGAELLSTFAGIERRFLILRALWGSHSATRLKCFLASLFLFSALAGAHAQEQLPPPEKIETLVKLLQDPEIQAWLRRSDEERGTPSPAPAPVVPTVAAWETATRTRIHAVVSAIPRIPGELTKTAKRVREDAVSRGFAPIFLLFAALVTVGLIGEGVYRRISPERDGFLARVLPVVVFAMSMFGLFFAIEWPPLARIALLVYLTAFVCFRLVSALLQLSNPKEGRARIRILAGLTILTVANSVFGSLVGIDPAVVDAISYISSLALLGFWLEAIWFVKERSLSRRFALMAAAIFVWLLWCLGFKGLFWIGIYTLILPSVLRMVGEAVLMLVPSATGLRKVALERGARAVVVIAAIAWLTVVWKMNPQGLGQRDPTLSALFYGFLKSAVFVLLADLLWHLAKCWIDGMLSADEEAGLKAEELARQGRLRTLLPILRNVAGGLVLIITALVVLAELGIEIGPLIAGAGIFGVAIGFGSQTLVKDVISGVFYMLDDAFRVGEYIQAKSYKGTVEGFSLRSVRLRHHRGPIFTVPFGELGAVENMSRDWGVVKFRISVGFNTDVEVARKLTKKVGAVLSEDPEFSALFIEPLKMKGVEEFGDYGLVLSFGMTLRPSPMQSFIRRRANLLLREAFLANGIQFAQPTVQVGGENATGHSSAASLQVISRNTNPAQEADATT